MADEKGLMTEIAEKIDAQEANVDAALDSLEKSKHTARWMALGAAAIVLLLMFFWAWG
jgi:DNA-binding MarR family transcriptional regulator